MVHLDACLWDAAEPKELRLSSRDQHGTITMCYTFVEVLDFIYISFLTGAAYPSIPALQDHATWAGGPQGLSAGDSCCALRGSCVRIVAYHMKSLQGPGVE